MQAEKLHNIDSNISVFPINTKNDKSSLDLVVFKPSEVAGVWILVEDLIQKACDRSGGFADAEDFKGWLEKGIMQLWVAFDNKEKKIKCVTVTEVKQYPKYKVCDCRITTGTDYKSWVDFMDNVVNWARANGCKKMEIFTRPGWERILKRKGFAKTHVQLEKML
jgi:hypothetical protein